MATQDIAAALARVRSVLERRPQIGLHDDAPAIARWQGGTRIVASHANGAEVRTDMPSELGGSGDQVTPGWLVRAGLAACTATRIAMGAAVEGIELKSLELQATSRTDTRGLLGIAEADGSRVDAGLRDIELVVRIAAPGVPPERLRALVEEAQRCSPVACALEAEVPIAMRIEVV
ncbi:MAG: OsmC family protein [Burkholderiales bacterium]|nr:OsmC family protein [Burkholderiales bacterium]